ncbi:shikimate dehydrogenase family protein [Blattabacterium cuenoti]|uniref:shikimate dehydrogenase family protein n=1 Tax=Blattabacterium cuenoti TaxID=1653831 RepID=UPI00163C5B5D|nr:shikimate dehydrogenase [Blattabacterium cuenoti]
MKDNYKNINKKYKYIFGLIGKNISYSLSRDFFLKKFDKEYIKNSTYLIFDIKNIDEVNSIFNISNLLGCNVTIPYKISIINFLDEISIEANKIKSVNVIKIKNNYKIGYNTDIIGFQKSFENLINSYPYKKNNNLKALILGTGGVSNTISFVLKKLGIKYKYVSRKKKDNKILNYVDLNRDLIEKYKIIINCTPVGTYPNINSSPNLPYKYIYNHHILYDLVYNPYKTIFLKIGEEKGALVKNGLEMLHIQAEESWKIWNSNI